ncbi:sigma 54-interacting transcriptional regulator [Deltaproteobacteria bacterium OttesenSCG-928-K17]|nr:sigma 54-interacting transcriptional regulator [Deltaproteobacteria bacterium OttesenSCG-928-K17]
MIDGSLKFYSLDASQFLLCLFEHYHEGVLIVDQNGILVYYNKTLAKLDGLDQQQVLGRHVTEVYQLDSSQSTSMLAMAMARPIINRPHVYRAVDGKLVNSISNAYPLYNNSVLVGAICIVSDYTSLVDNYAKTETTALKQPENAKKAAKTFTAFEDLIAQDERMLAAIDVARRAAATPSPVMLIGETGTGKELFAKAVHCARHGVSKPFMAINCAAIPATLLEAVLFGTSKGAFTGAVEKAGLFELADGGTLFLDELNGWGRALQPKLLRVLQEKCVRRVGSSDETPISVKIVSALNVSPFEAIEQGAFRADLFYRLGVVMVNLPPLRGRRADIPALLEHFVEKFNAALNKQVRGFTPEAYELLSSHHWPGNVREMEHTVEAAMNYIDDTVEYINTTHIRAAVPLIDFDRKPFSSHGGGVNSSAGQGLMSRSLAASSGVFAAPSSPPVARPDEADDFDGEAEQISQCLRKTRGNVARAARMLGYSPQRLHYRLKKLNINSADFKGRV